MLTAYQQRTRLLLQDETFKVYRSGDLRDYINEARNQVAGDAECVITTGSLTMVPPIQVYNFGSIGLQPGVGLGTVQKVRLARVNIGTGNLLVYPRAWEWFQLYTLDQPAPIPGPPVEFAQQGQGAFGTLWFNLPDYAYLLNLDVVCLPIGLVDDSTLEAIPLLWTIAVPFYAAWRALLTHPSPQIDPDKMLERYQQMMGRARSGATPDLVGNIWSQAPDLALQNRYGISRSG